MLRPIPAGNELLREAGAHRVASLLAVVPAQGVGDQASGAEEPLPLDAGGQAVQALAYHGRSQGFTVLDRIDARECQADCKTQAAIRQQMYRAEPAVGAAP